MLERWHTDCRHFTGYSPCRFHRPCEGCPEHAPVGADVLLINLDALGDVLRTTALVPAIRRSVPGCRLTWLTRARAAPLLENHPGVDRVLVLGDDALVELRSRRFDLLLNADKGRVSGALADQVEAEEKRGFTVLANGAIAPLGPSALHLYELGLDDELKFRANQRTEPDLLAEALGVVYRRDRPSLVLRPEERSPGTPRAVGFNTGCSPLYPYKKLPLDTQARAIGALAEALGEPVLLLGGPEDAERNDALAARLGPRAERTPTDGGLRRGAAEVDRCSVVVSGDSLGMHMAIALRKHVVAWFGVSCPQEIDLFDQGVKVLADVTCAPCWRKTCDKVPLCVDRVEPDWIVQAVHRCLDARASGRPIDDVLGGGWWGSDPLSAPTAR